MAKTTQQRLIDLYLGNIGLIEEGLPSFINKCRMDAIETFNLNPLPDKKSEKYKYCDIKSRYTNTFKKPFGVSQDTERECRPLPVECYEINLLNGYSDGGLTTLNNGVIYGSIKAAANSHPELLKGNYNTLAASDLDPLAALNTAFMQDGAFIYIPRNTTAEKPFVINECLNSKEDIYVYERNVLIFGENSSAKVIFNSYTASANSFLANTMREVFSTPNSNVEITDIQHFNNKTTCVLNSYAELKGDSNFKSVVFSIDGGMIRNNSNTVLSGRGGESHNYGLYLPSKGQYIDNYTNTEHNTPDCTSFEHYKGIASGDGTAVFQGRILVAIDAQRTQAYLENHNLSMSDDASVYTKPQLEIYADDVKCSHGATTGQLDENAIFYMRQRGISETNAKKLQMRGFVNDVIGKAGIPQIADFLNDLAEAKIEKME